MESEIYEDIETASAVARALSFELYQRNLGSDFYVIQSEDGFLVFPRPSNNKKHKTIECWRDGKEM